MNRSENYISFIITITKIITTKSAIIFLSFLKYLFMLVLQNTQWQIPIQRHIDLEIMSVVVFTLIYQIYFLNSMEPAPAIADNYRVCFSMNSRFRSSLGGFAGMIGGFCRIGWKVSCRNR